MRQGLCCMVALVSCYAHRVTLLHLLKSHNPLSPPKAGNNVVAIINVVVVAAIIIIITIVVYLFVMFILLLSDFLRWES